MKLFHVHTILQIIFSWLQLDCAWLNQSKWDQPLAQQPLTFSNSGYLESKRIHTYIYIYNLAQFGQKRLIALNYITFRRRDDIIHRTRESGSEDSSKEMCKWNKHWNHSRLRDPNPTFDSQKSFPRNLTKKLHRNKCH
jgi:hypothetical protein